MEKTGLGWEAVGNALRRLDVEGQIEGVRSKDFPYPTTVKRYLF